MRRTPFSTYFLSIKNLRPGRCSDWRKARESNPRARRPGVFKTLSSSVPDAFRWSREREFHPREPGCSRSPGSSAISTSVRSRELRDHLGREVGFEPTQRGCRFQERRFLRQVTNPLGVRHLESPASASATRDGFWPASYLFGLPLHTFSGALIRLRYSLQVVTCAGLEPASRRCERPFARPLRVARREDPRYEPCETRASSSRVRLEHARAVGAACRDRTCVSSLEDWCLSHSAKAA